MKRIDGNSGSSMTLRIARCTWCVQATFRLGTKCRRATGVTLRQLHSRKTVHCMRRTGRSSLALKIGAWCSTQLTLQSALYTTGAHVIPNPSSQSFYDSHLHVVLFPPCPNRVTSEFCIHIYHFAILSVSHAWFQSSGARQAKNALFWVITQRVVAIYYRRFGTTYRSHRQGSIIQKKWRLIGCPKTSVRNYRGADKSLARPGRKQATATEDFDVHISYL